MPVIEQDNTPDPRIVYEREVTRLASAAREQFGAEYALGALVAVAVALMDTMPPTFTRRVLRFMAEKLGVGD